jgi:hypothetical protein
MNHFSFMLADADINDIIQQGAKMDPRMYEFLVTFGAIALAILVAVIWAVIYSLKKKKRKDRHGHHREESTTKTRRRPVQVVREVSLEAEPQQSHSQRRRRHRRPTNPTLAETRGLPPLRDENTPLPPMP